MNAADLVTKTAAGLDEVKSRKRGLPQRLRTMLILVDGSLTEAQLRQAADKLGAPADFLELLEQQGLIERSASSASALQPVPGAAPPSADDVPAPVSELSENARFTAARKLMNDAVVDALGLRAFFITLKFEKCSNTGDLLALLPEIVVAVSKKGRATEAASTLDAQVRALLR